MTSQDQCQNGESTYLAELFAEKEALIVDPSFKHSPILLAHEIDRIQTGSKKMIDLHINKPIKVETKVRLPVKEYPHFNFVGKIIGPKANTLKQLQDETGTKLIIQGAGSMRDKAKEEELRREGGKYAHLHEELHLLIEAYGPPAECYRRISLALYRLSDFFAQENIGEFAKLGIGRGRGMMMQGRAPHPGMAVAPGVSSPDRLPLSNPHASWPTNSSPRMRANKPATTSNYTPQFNPLIFAPASSSSTGFSSNGNECSPNLLSSQMFNPTDPCSSHLDYEGSITEEDYTRDRMPIRGHLRSSSRLHPY